MSRPFLLADSDSRDGVGWIRPGARASHESTRSFGRLAAQSRHPWRLRRPSRPIGLAAPTRHRDVNGFAPGHLGEMPTAPRAWQKFAFIRRHDEHQRPPVVPGHIHLGPRPLLADVDSGARCAARNGNRVVEDGSRRRAAQARQSWRLSRPSCPLAPISRAGRKDATGGDVGPTLEG